MKTSTTDPLETTNLAQDPDYQQASLTFIGKISSRWNSKQIRAQGINIQIYTAYYMQSCTQVTMNTGMTIRFPMSGNNTLATLWTVAA